MSKEYTMEALEKTFKKHAIQAKANNKKMLREFLDNNPGEPVPAWFLDTFCINTAFAAMCAEIIKLKEKK